MIRTKGEAGTGNVVEAVRHIRAITSGSGAGSLEEAELDGRAAKELARRSTWSARWRRRGGCPVVLFGAGGIATPADAALMMQLGAEGVFVGSGIFKSEDPERRARAIVEATRTTRTPDAWPQRRASLGEADDRDGDRLRSRPRGGLLQERGW